MPNTILKKNPYDDEKDAALEQEEEVRSPYRTSIQMTIYSGLFAMGVMMFCILIPSPGRFTSSSSSQLSSASAGFGRLTAGVADAAPTEDMVAPDANVTFRSYIATTSPSGAAAATATTVTSSNGTPAVGVAGTKPRSAAAKAIALQSASDESDQVFYFASSTGPASAPAAPTPSATIDQRNGYRETTLSFGQYSFSADISDTEALRDQGLSDRSSVASDEAMLFVFDTPDYYSFWMKDMLVPLDMVWLDANKKVVYIAANVAPDTYPEAFTPSTKALYVIEFQAGTAARIGLSDGDTIGFSL